MATTTKLELTQLLAARNQELLTLRAEVSCLRADVERLSKKAPGAGSPSPARIAYLASKQHRADRQAGMPSEYQQRCAVAREMAMATGKAVKV
jgi:hypothetical protein